MTVTALTPPRQQCLWEHSFFIHCLTAGTGCPPKGTPTEQPEGAPIEQPEGGP